MDIRRERFSIPLLNKNTIKRPEIIEQIDILSKRGILFLYAPAGYGKTTAVALWAGAKNGREVAWLSLDEYSSEPAEIYRGLLLALSRDIPEGFADAPLESTLHELDGIGACPEAVIIDNFHLCTNPSAIRALPLIRARIPRDTAFIILSRSEPPAALIDQTLKGSLSQFSVLRFSSAEILALFAKGGSPITKDEAETLLRRTDGWPAALAAILMSGEGLSSDILDSEALNHYLKTHVFAPEKEGATWENYSVLKKCSVCDVLTPGFCRAVTGRDDAWNVISGLTDKTGLVYHAARDTYRFHSLLKEFLESELELDDAIDKPSLYKTAARCFMESGDFLHALDMVSKSRDIAAIEECLRAKRDSYGKFDAGVGEHASAFLKHVYFKVPVSDIKGSLCLSLECFSALFMSGRLTESFEWIDAAGEIFRARSSENTRNDIISTMLLTALDPRRDVWDLPLACRRIEPLLSAAQTGEMTFFSITINLPFFHKAQVDYSIISPRLDAFCANVSQYMGSVLGPLLGPLSALMHAGVLYERGELEKAETIAAETAQMAKRFPPEVQFAAMALYAEILRVQGKKFETGGIGEMIASTKARYLSANYRAFTANINLARGDKDAAEDWLARSEMENPLKFYKIYQYFTTARALMVTGKLAEAEPLTERLAAFSSAYRRPSERIEALALKALCLWHMKRSADSIEAMIAAIIEACDLQVVMPIIKEGGDVLPVLEKILNRLKHGYDAEVLDKSFVNKLFYGAHAMSRHKGLMVRDKGKDSVKLSARQSEILGYLERNLSYREISVKMGVKVTTVGDHIDKLYEKLGVSNARDAVTRAMELGIHIDPANKG